MYSWIDVHVGSNIFLSICSIGYYYWSWQVGMQMSCQRDDERVCVVTPKSDEIRVTTPQPPTRMVEEERRRRKSVFFLKKIKKFVLICFFLFSLVRFTLFCFAFLFFALLCYLCSIVGYSVSGLYSIFTHPILHQFTPTVSFQDSI